MDIKRVLIAVTLSMLVLFAWNWFFPPPQPVRHQAPAPQAEQAETGVSEVTPPAGPAVELGSGAEQTPAPRQLDGKDIQIQTPLYTAVLNSDGGILTSFRLLDYQQSIDPDSKDVDLIGKRAATALPLQLILGDKPRWTFSGKETYALRSPGDTAVLTFTGQLGEVRLVRELTFNADTYLIQDKVTIENSTANRLKGSLGFTLAATSLTSEDDRYNLTRVAALSGGSLDEENDPDDIREKEFVKYDRVQWGGLQSNYFLLALLPSEKSSTSEEGPTFRVNMDDDVFVMIMDEPLGAIDPAQSKTYSCSYFLGPKKKEALDAAPNNLDRAVDLGWFDFIAKPLLIGLEFIYSGVRNYGVAIIILTIIIKIILWPLSHKSYKSMEQMKKLQPMLAKIREKHKDDRQKMNEEMMNLYKTYKVNPAGGCLPMILQIPVFIGLYQALLQSIELRHAAFITHLPFTDIIWLADLSAKDPFYITPIVMGATMFLQQKMMPAPGDPMQAKIMLFMPIFFTFIFLNFPAGLVIYWLANNVLSIAQQWWMLRKA
jgi:YidC/Oxa1 family membrane protein insertase